jgi:hypothetical protein
MAVSGMVMAMVTAVIELTRVVLQSSVVVHVTPRCVGR